MGTQGIVSNYPEPNLLAENIKKDVEIFGVVGSLETGGLIGTNGNYVGSVAWDTGSAKLSPGARAIELGDYIYTFHGYGLVGGGMGVLCAKINKATSEITYIGFKAQAGSGAGQHIIGNSSVDGTDIYISFFNGGLFGEHIKLDTLTDTLTGDSKKTIPGTIVNTSSVTVGTKTYTANMAAQTVATIGSAFAFIGYIAIS